jgi:hypothetical protein
MFLMLPVAYEFTMNEHIYILYVTLIQIRNHFEFFTFASRTQWQHAYIYDRIFTQWKCISIANMQMYVISKSNIFVTWLVLIQLYLFKWLESLTFLVSIQGLSWPRCKAHDSPSSSQSSQKIRYSVCTLETLLSKEFYII